MLGGAAEKLLSYFADSQDAKSIKHLLKKDEIPLPDFSALFRCVFEQIKNMRRRFLYLMGTSAM